MPDTSDLGLPYPLPTDAIANGANDIQNLATALDAHLRIASGVVSIPTNAANTQAQVTVTFPAARFTAAPAVTVTGVSLASPQIVSVAIAAPTASSVIIGGIRTTGTTAFNAHWIAIQGA
ncbi:MAG: hypothetical protein J2P17_33230 [Mycobacterium sp.]|nr:hypothetical protein [Mycobacterium sp.]